MLAKGRGGSAVDKLEAATGVRCDVWLGGAGGAACSARTKSSLSKNPAVEIPLTRPLSASRKPQNEIQIRAAAGNK